MRKLKYVPRYCPSCGEPFRDPDVIENLNGFEFICSCTDCTPGVIVIQVVIGKEAKV